MYKLLLIYCLVLQKDSTFKIEGIPHQINKAYVYKLFATLEECKAATHRDTFCIQQEWGTRFQRVHKCFCEFQFYGKDFNSYKDFLTNTDCTIQDDGQAKCNCPTEEYFIFSYNNMSRCIKKKECDKNPCKDINRRCMMIDYKKNCDYCKRGFVEKDGICIRDPCYAVKCGSREYCKPKGDDGYECVCEHNSRRHENMSCVLDENFLCKVFNETCGPNSNCTVFEGALFCFCLKYGNPPYCVMNCSKNEQCEKREKCIDGECKHACVGACASNTNCRADDHEASCLCLENYTGDPLTTCTPMTECEKILDKEMCGKNSDCHMVGDTATCICKNASFGTPPECRNYCEHDNECKSEETCYKDKCVSVCEVAKCPMLNTECVGGKDHKIICDCKANYTGASIYWCNEMSECNPNKCGNLTECNLDSEGKAECKCTDFTFGFPPNCKINCESDEDCLDDEQCMSDGMCIKPCRVDTWCPEHSHCVGVNHTRQCHCDENYFPTTEYSFPCRIKTDCHPTNDCGPHSHCRMIIDSSFTRRALCTCAPGAFGEPPKCRLNCNESSECNDNDACIESNCSTPCVEGYCAGDNTECRAANHTPSCHCLERFAGNATEGCKQITACFPTHPCGEGGICELDDDELSKCSCFDNYTFGEPPDCRNYCLEDNECKFDEACIDGNCTSPCDDACGENATCEAQCHKAHCQCFDGFTGDAVKGCSYITACQPERNKCGLYSTCVEEDEDTPTCSCIHFGDPPECKTRCDSSEECKNTTLACEGGKCVPACTTIVCESDAECQTTDHIPKCQCKEGYTGAHGRNCEKITGCYPHSECGENAKCTMTDEETVECECVPPFEFGEPPDCRKNCVSDTECPEDQYCDKKCRSLCRRDCGDNMCEIVDRKAICACHSGYTGDPYKETCYYLSICDERRNYCGHNSKCVERYTEKADCSCLDGYIGIPPFCKQCSKSGQCTFDNVCENGLCIDTCKGDLNKCGENTDCIILNHVKRCQCKPKYTGDPLKGCRIMSECEIGGICGPFSTCELVPNADPICNCMKGHVGEPPNCRPCTFTHECPEGFICNAPMCRSPCAEKACGANTDCFVDDEDLECECKTGYVGDPYVAAGCKSIFGDDGSGAKPLQQSDEERLRKLGLETPPWSTVPYLISFMDYCSGSLISATWVLTAGHCYLGGSMYVRVGKHLHDMGFIVPVKRHYIHPRYSKRGIYDFMLLKLKIAVAPKPAKIDLDIRIIPGNKMKAYGYADSLVHRRRGFGDVQVIVARTVIMRRQKKCRRMFSRFRFHQSMICAGNFNDDHNTCVGNSGGPVVRNGVLVGVVMWGVGCAPPRLPNVYASIASAREWLQDVLL